MMITLAIADAVENSQQALRFIYHNTIQTGLRVQSIYPEQVMRYSTHKRQPLRHYIRFLEEEDKCDVLIIHLTKEALKKQRYYAIDFNMVLLFDSRVSCKKDRMRYLQVSQHLINSVHSHYYILPYRYKRIKPGSITYGWNTKAHISVSSAYETLNGETQIRCCVSDVVPSMTGETMPIREFGINVASDQVEGILAGVALLITLGLEIQ